MLLHSGLLWRLYSPAFLEVGGTSWLSSFQCKVEEWTCFQIQPVKTSHGISVIAAQTFPCTGNNEHAIFKFISMVSWLDSAGHCSLSWLLLHDCINVWAVKRTKENLSPNILVFGGYFGKLECWNSVPCGHLLHLMSILDYLLVTTVWQNWINSITTYWPNANRESIDATGPLQLRNPTELISVHSTGQY